MAAQYIYTMHKLSRYYPPDREVLKDINLSFYPGAKIGVLGANGAGKSSLLKVMAGADDGFTTPAAAVDDGGTMRPPAMDPGLPFPDTTVRSTLP